MIFKKLSEVLGGKGEAPTERELDDARLARTIAAKSSVYNIRRAIREAEEEDETGLPAAAEISQFEVPLDGLVVEEISMEEASEVLAQNDTGEAFQEPAPKSETNEDTIGPSSFRVDEFEDTGTFFGTSTAGIEVEELGNDPIEFDGNSSRVLTAWGTFNTEGVNTEEQERSWDDISLGRDDAMFRRGSS